MLPALTQFLTSFCTFPLKPHRSTRKLFCPFKSMHLFRAFMLRSQSFPALPRWHETVAFTVYRLCAGVWGNALFCRPLLTLFAGHSGKSGISCCSFSFINDTLFISIRFLNDELSVKLKWFRTRPNGPTVQQPGSILTALLFISLLLRVAAQQWISPEEPVLSEIWDNVELQDSDVRWVWTRLLVVFWCVSTS